MHCPLISMPQGPGRGQILQETEQSAESMLLLICCATLGKLVGIPEPQLFHLQKRDIPGSL